MTVQFGGNFLQSEYPNILFRPHRLHSTETDACYCYDAVVCLSRCWSRPWAPQNSWDDRYAELPIRVLRLGGPKKQCIRGCISPLKLALLWGADVEIPRTPIGRCTGRSSSRVSHKIFPLKNPPLQCGLSQNSSTTCYYLSITVILRILLSSVSVDIDALHVSPWSLLINELVKKTVLLSSMLVFKLYRITDFCVRFKL